MNIRFVTPGDCAALLGIYAQYIDTPITFEYALPDESEFSVRISAISRDYPYLVCEESGRPVGYAYAHRHMERAAYQWDAELSVYLDRGCTARGLGTRLYGALIDILRLQGIRTVYGCVTLPNEKSEGLHRSLGFRPIGVWRSAGYKCGVWHDVGWFEKQIAPYPADPAPIVSAGRLDQEQLHGILRRYEEER